MSRQWRARVWIAGIVGIIVGVTGCSRSGVLERQKIAEARLQLGLAYLQLGERELAQQNILRVIEYQPEEYRGYLALAKYQQYVHEYAAAEENYLTAIKLSLNSGNAHNNYGAFLCYLGQYTKAQQQFSWVIEQYGSEYLADSLEYSGYCFLQAEQFDNAKQALSRLLSHQPDRIDTLLSVAKDYVKQKKCSQVTLLLSIHRQITPENTAARRQFALANSYCCAKRVPTGCL